MLSVARAFMIHIFTACGAALGFLALILATGEQWAAMFICLGLALVVDGIDGPLARTFHVGELLPRWSGDILDLVVDFITYVFVPAYAIVASGLLPDTLAIPAGHCRGNHRRALFRRPRHEDAATIISRAFRPCGIWWLSISICCRPPSWAAAIAIAALAVLTFVPFRFVHPLRVQDLRMLNIALMAAVDGAGGAGIDRQSRSGPWITWPLAAIAVYFLDRGLFRSLRPDMLELLTDANAWAALLTLTALEIVLGIDNLVFISVLMARARRATPSARAADRPLARLRLPHLAAAA